MSFPDVPLRVQYARTGRSACVVYLFFEYNSTTHTTFISSGPLFPLSTHVAPLYLLQFTLFDGDSHYKNLSARWEYWFVERLAIPIYHLVQGLDSRKQPPSLSDYSSFVQSGSA